MSRILTAVALIPAVIGAIFFAPYPVFWGVIIVLAILCYREYTNLVKAHGLETFAIAGYAAGLLYLGEIPRYSLSLPVLIVIAGMILTLRVSDLRNAMATAGAFALGIFYIFGAWSSALQLRQASAHWMFFAIALNWAGDVSAYYVGRAIGKHKLAPQVSPNKSWEGAIASALASIIFGVFYLGWALPDVPVWQRIVLAIAGNVAGQCGDLAESAFKRGAGVKDSGNMLPGHGGWLDRLDSSLFSMPVVAALRVLLP